MKHKIKYFNWINSIIFTLKPEIIAKVFITYDLAKGDMNYEN